MLLHIHLTLAEQFVWQRYFRHMVELCDVSLGADRESDRERERKQSKEQRERGRKEGVIPVSLILSQPTQSSNTTGSVTLDTLQEGAPPSTSTLLSPASGHTQDIHPVSIPVTVFCICLTSVEHVFEASLLRSSYNCQDREITMEEDYNRGFK